MLKKQNINKINILNAYVSLHQAHMKLLHSLQTLIPLL